MEDLAAVLEDDRHEKGCVGGHGVVERERGGGVALCSFPDRQAAVRQGERGQTRRLRLILPEPRM
jgi:hypothetical protein